MGIKTFAVNVSTLPQSNRDKIYRAISIDAFYIQEPDANSGFIHAVFSAPLSIDALKARYAIPSSCTVNQWTC